jgi:hypothetical protein
VEESLGGGGGTRGRGKGTPPRRGLDDGRPGCHGTERGRVRSRVVPPRPRRGRSDRFPALFFPARRVPVDVVVETAAVPAAARLKWGTVRGDGGGWLGCPAFLLLGRRFLPVPAPVSGQAVKGSGCCY